MEADDHGQQKTHDHVGRGLFVEIRLKCDKQPRPRRLRRRPPALLVQHLALAGDFMDQRGKVKSKTRSSLFPVEFATAVPNRLLVPKGENYRPIVGSWQ